MGVAWFLGGVSRRGCCLGEELVLGGDMEDAALELLSFCTASLLFVWKPFWISGSSPLLSKDRCLRGDEAEAPPPAVHAGLKSGLAFRTLFDGSVLMLVLGLLPLIG